MYNGNANKMVYSYIGFEKNSTSNSIFIMFQLKNIFCSIKLLIKKILSTKFSYTGIYLAKLYLNEVHGFKSPLRASEFEKKL